MCFRQLTIGVSNVISTTQHLCSDNQLSQMCNTNGSTDLHIMLYLKLPVLCLYKSAVLYPQISAAHPTSLSLKLIGISSRSSRDCIFFLFAAARARQESINIKEGLEGGRGNPLFVLDPLYSVQLIENSGGISAMMVIQFSKETHFRQRERERA